MEVMEVWRRDMNLKNSKILLLVIYTVGFCTNARQISSVKIISFCNRTASTYLNFFPFQISSKSIYYL
jgi:hypothetical protein